MNVSIKDVWWERHLLTDNRETIKVKGQLVEYRGKTGRVHLVWDVATSNAGHGMGEVSNSQVVLCTDNMECIVLKDGTTGIKLLEE